MSTKTMPTIVCLCGSTDFWEQIDFSDEVFVLNFGGYIGDSIRGEIKYAIEHGKAVNYLEGQ